MPRAAGTGAGSRGKDTDEEDVKILLHHYSINQPDFANRPKVIVLSCPLACAACL